MTAQPSNISSKSSIASFHTPELDQILHAELIHWVEYLNAPHNDKCDATASKIMALFTGARAQYGLFAVDNARELAFSSMFAATLQQHWSQDLFVCHQSPLDDMSVQSTADIIVYYNNDMQSRNYRPIAVFECGMGSQSKSLQLSAYCGNCFAAQFPPLDKHQPVVFGFELLDIQTSQPLLVMHAACPLHDKFTCRTIWRGGLQQTILAKVLHALEMMARNNLCHAEQRSARIAARIATIGNVAYKLFDSNDSSRQHTHYRFLPTSCNLKHLFDTSHWQYQVIRYNLIQGKHCPTLVRQVMQVINMLGVMHNEHIVHGDVRRHNIVFGQDESSLIDFDFAGVEGHAYRFEPNRSIDDGCFHDDVGLGKPMRCEHDRYSLQCILVQFDTEVDSDYSQIIKQLASSQLSLSHIADQLLPLERLKLVAKHQ
jgi:hypothetical protein